ncbi:MAG: hypothetical protein ACREOQ_01230 [Gemmatimonadales bacterium]
MPRQFTFRALQSVPDLGLRAGDLLIITPGDHYPLNLIRPVPSDLPAAREALDQGQLELCTVGAEQDVQEFLGPPPRPKRRPGGYGRLQLVKGGANAQA